MVFLSISTHFIAPLKIPFTSTILQIFSIFCTFQVKPKALTKDLKYQPTDSLRPINPDNTCIPCITAAAGTGLADAYSSSTRQNFFLEKRGLQPAGLPPSRGIALSGLRPLQKIPHCCLPQKFGPYLSSNVADHPLTPATDHRLMQAFTLPTS